MRKYYVYIYFNPFKTGGNYGPLFFDKQPFYIGKGCGNRYRDHIWNHVGNNQEKIQEVKNILQHGVEPIVILYKQNMLEEEALDLERALVSTVGRKDLGNGPLLNKTDGGDRFSNCTMSEAGKENIRRAGRLRKASLNFINNRQAKWSGEGNPNYGGKLSTGRDSPLKGRSRPPEFGEEHSAKLRKFFSDPENRLKMRRLGSSNGKAKLTDEQAATIREATGVTMRSLATLYKVSVSTISAIKSGKSRKLVTS